MRKTASLLIAILLISLLASSSVTATSTSNRSRGVTIVQVIHFYIHSFYGHLFDIEEREPIVSIDDTNVIVGGDADHLGGGKIDQIGSGTSDTNTVLLGGSSNLVKTTD